LINNIAKQFGDFVSKTVAAVSSKPFSMPDITEFSNEAKDASTCVDQRCSGNFIVTGVCWVFSLIYVSNNSSFTDEGGGAELRQLDTTGCGRSQNSSGMEVTEFQWNAAVK